MRTVSCCCSGKPTQGMPSCKGTEPSNSWESWGEAGYLTQVSHTWRESYSPWQVSYGELGLGKPTRMLSRSSRAIWGKPWQRPIHEHPSDASGGAGAQHTSTFVLHTPQTISGSRTLGFLTKCRFHRHSVEREPGAVCTELEALPPPSPRTALFCCFSFWTSAQDFI